jgi:hypothetical protein
MGNNDVDDESDDEDVDDESIDPFFRCPSRSFLHLAAGGEGSVGESLEWVDVSAADPAALFNSLLSDFEARHHRPPNDVEMARLHASMLREGEKEAEVAAIAAIAAAQESDNCSGQPADAARPTLIQVTTTSADTHKRDRPSKIPVTTHVMNSGHNQSNV